MHFFLNVQLLLYHTDSGKHGPHIGRTINVQSLRAYDLFRSFLPHLIVKKLFVGLLKGTSGDRALPPIRKEFSALIVYVNGRPFFVRKLLPSCDVILSQRFSIVNVSL